MSQVKPHIVLVPGAWHSPIHYQELIELLEKAGYSVKSMQLPSVGSKEPNQVSVATDATAIREKLLLPLLDDGKDVILLMHSYGGCPGAAAAKGLGKHDSNANGRGSIVGLIFLTAFLAREGDSLLSALQGKFDPWVEINDETGQLDVIDPAQVFYHDVPEQKRAKAIENLQLHSRVALSTPSPPSAWADSEFNGRRAYIRALDDRTIVPIAQEMMVKHSGVEWDYREIDSSHSPFLSQPENLTKVILDIISRF